MNTSIITRCYQKATALFNEQFGMNYKVDNPKLHIVSYSTPASVVNKIIEDTGCDLCKTEDEHFFSDQYAQAFFGPKGDAVAFSSDVEYSEPVAVYIMLHELAHIFCGHHEDHNRLFLKSCRDRNDDNLDQIGLGSQIWTEAIANYMASGIVENKRPGVGEIYPQLKQIAYGINPENENRICDVSTYLTLLAFCRESERGWTVLQKAMQKYNLPFQNVAECFCEQLQIERYWEISEELCENIGASYIDDYMKHSFGSPEEIAAIIAANPEQALRMLQIAG